MRKNNLQDENERFPLSPDYYYGLDEQPTDFIDRWYFDYIIHCKQKNPLKEQEVWAGAPGFTIHKSTKELTVISIHTLHYLRDTKTLLLTLEVAHVLKKNREREKELQCSVDTIRLVSVSGEAVL